LKVQESVGGLTVGQTVQIMSSNIKADISNTDYWSVRH